MMSARWLRGILMAGSISVLAGCAAHQPKPMYMWGAFPRQQYDVLLHDGVNAAEQIQVLETHAEKVRGKGAALPPGFRAHLGMLKLSVGDAEGARQLWEAEKEAFPESAPYMGQLLKRLDKPNTVASEGSPI